MSNRGWPGEFQKYATAFQTRLENRGDQAVPLFSHFFHENVLETVNILPNG